MDMVAVTNSTTVASNDPSVDLPLGFYTMKKTVRIKNQSMLSKYVVSRKATSAPSDPC